ncbi:adenosine deaminase [Conexibacter woesei]|uniref:Adenine deaminase n=1 Tax=Conexibacter woesei (strain DSM 14684 / CCUG 47730 / CIP 108061 / JCM 11494 / NBRC 100937 / ID131577) TaxID=469383 RepID=D3F6W1_CONWI|nr:adenosine deaminase [Conexibacter woesei]ADB52759.1 adenosine deaminase [Conexibacter woesei DSM 14684]
MRDELAYRLPKAELHVHAEACLEPELLLQIAERNGHDLPYASIDEVRRAYEWSDLGAFLDLYYRHIEVLRTETDFRQLVESYMSHAAEQGVRHVEMFFDPQAHTRRGVPLATVVDGLAAGLDSGAREHGISGALIACFIRELGVESAQETLAELAELPAFERIVGIGLDSIEEGFPPPLFAPLYAQARALGLLGVIHAGEAGPGENVGLALSVLGVERIDHGVRCGDDAASIAALRERGTALTVCPLSNVRIGMYETLADHPVAQLLRDGLEVTINSDGPAYFGGYIADNWVAVQRQFDLDVDDLVTLARRSIAVSFATAERKAQLLREIDRMLDKATATN